MRYAKSFKIIFRARNLRNLQNIFSQKQYLLCAILLRRCEKTKHDTLTKPTNSRYS